VRKLFCIGQAVVFCLCISVSSNAQLNNLLNEAKSMEKKMTGNNSKGGGLSSGEISEGLKQALKVGAQNATGKVSAVNGFFGDAAIKILMPPEAARVETALRDIGLGKQVDDAILSMNRGAEDAAKQALPIFVNAIVNMSIDDGLKILKGNNNAATEFLRNKTYGALYNAFLPIVKSSLDKVGATKYWAEIFKLYDEIPFNNNKVNTDLPAYVTDKAIKGVFVYIASEEAKIRTNPAARVTDLLKKVFG
jgi:Protein of unknown function (DUF4197)